MVGKCITIKSDVAEMFGRDSVTIYQVFDARLAGGTYIFRAAPVGIDLDLNKVALDYSEQVELFAEDFVTVGR